MKHKIILSIAFSLALLASGCGKKNNDAAQSTGQFSYVNGQYYPVGNATPGPQILGQYPYFYVNYSVNEANCTTGTRRFSGNDYFYVKSLMCESFYNDSMNQNCGRAQREQWFAALCR